MRANIIGPSWRMPDRIMLAMGGDPIISGGVEPILGGGVIAGERTEGEGRPAMPGEGIPAAPGDDCGGGPLGVVSIAA